MDKTLNSQWEERKQMQTINTQAISLPKNAPYDLKFEINKSNVIHYLGTKMTIEQAVEALSYKVSRYCEDCNAIYRNMCLCGDL